MEWRTVKNPRKSNGDLGDKECSFCGGQSGAYVVHSNIQGFLYIVCKKCLEDGIKAINKTILEDVK